jgi:hypothetical protein
VPDEFAGKKVRCKGCGATFRVDNPASGEEDPGPRSKDESRRSARSRDDEDDRPRRRREEDDEPRSRRRQDDDEEPRSRRARDEDDESDDRPRRKGSGKKTKKRITVAYVLGLLVALVFLAVALGFLAWRAGLFEPKTETKQETVQDDKEPEYTPPDPRIAAARKETTGPDGERVAATQRIRLSLDSVEAGKIVLSFQVTSGPGLGGSDRLVAVEADRTYIVDAAPQTKEDDPRRGTFTIDLPEESRRKVKKFWIAMAPRGTADVKKAGVRVSNVVNLP